MTRYSVLSKVLESAESNIRAVLAMATDDELHEGVHWYDDTRQWLDSVSRDTGIPLEYTARVFAALSPSNRIAQNRVDCLTVCNAVSNGASVGDAGKYTVATFDSNKYKAFRIAHGELDALSGPKVQAFASNLLGDLDQVTVDRHAFNVAAGAEYIVDNRGPDITDKRRRRIIEAYQNVARELDLAPAEVQAITWIVWKRITGR